MNRKAQGFDAIGVAAVETLERRQLMAGLTLITHGREASGAMAGWVEAMADEIDARTSQQDARIRLTLAERPSGELFATATSLNGLTPATSKSGQTVVTLDWSSLSTGLIFPTHNTVEVGAAATAALLSPLLLPSFGRAFSELPLHLIGHSRGGSLISDIARRLSAAGVWVDHLTTLDAVPHPLGSDAAAGVAQTVLYADNYYQTQDVLRGASLAGRAYNRNLGALPAGYSSSHSDVHLWYHATADIQGAFSDGAAGGADSLRDSWFGAGDNRGATTGFSQSRVAGGTRYDAGLHASLGGAATREAMNAPSAHWPSVIDLSVGIGPDNRLLRGAVVDVNFTYADYNSNAALSIRLDRDKNPYNNNNSVTLVGAEELAATTGVIAANGEMTWNTAGQSTGTYYLYAAITDSPASGRTRYLYREQPIHIISLGSVEPGPFLDGALVLDLPSNIPALDIDDRTIGFQAHFGESRLVDIGGGTRRDNDHVVLIYWWSSESVGTAESDRDLPTLNPMQQSRGIAIPRLCRV